MLKKLLLGISLVIAACGVIYITGKFLAKRDTDRSEWPTTQGTVIDSTEYHLDDDLYRWVKFRYQLGGEEYVHEQAFAVLEEEYLSEFGNKPPEIARERWKYSPGTVVPVYYNPMNPEDASVDPWGYDFQSANEILLPGLALCGA